MDIQKIADRAFRGRPEAPRGLVAPHGSAQRRLGILHVLFSSKLAGSEISCIDLANEQAELGHDVHVAGNHWSPVRALLSGKVTYHGFMSPFLRRAGLRRLIAATSIDICHGHLSPACKALAGMAGGPVTIATLHVGFKPRQHAKLDGLICVNSAQMRRLGDYAGKASVISNWLPDFRRGEARDLRSELNLRPDTLLVGGVGRLHPSKGFDLLVSAFRRAAPDNAALVIIGEGPQRGKLMKLAAGDRRIHLLGHCDNVPGFLGNLDLFVSPSREETFGLAILEAMRERLVIISTATEGPSEYLRSYPVTLVEPGSVDGLSEALAHALGAARGAEPTRIDYDLRRFSRSTGVANVLDFYSRCLGYAESPSVAEETKRPEVAAMPLPHVS